MARLHHIIVALIALLSFTLCQAKEKPEPDRTWTVTDQESFNEALEETMLSGKNSLHVMLDLRPELVDKRAVSRIKRQANKKKREKSKAEQAEAQEALKNVEKYSYLKGKGGSSALVALVEHSNWERYASSFIWIPAGSGWRLSFTVEDSTRMLVAYRTPKYREKLSRKEQAALDELTKRLKKIIKPGMSDREKTNAISRDLQQRAKYSFAGDDQSCAQLILRNTGVCEAFSRYMFLALQMEGIESMVVTGDAKGSHAWNMVYLDQQWYHLDATWGIGLVSGKTMREFHQHVWNAALYPASIED